MNHAEQPAEHLATVALMAWTDRESRCAPLVFMASALVGIAVLLVSVLPR